MITEINQKHRNMLVNTSLYILLFICKSSFFINSMSLDKPVFYFQPTHEF